MAKFIVFKTESNGHRTFVGSMTKDYWWVKSPSDAFYYDDDFVQVKDVITGFEREYTSAIMGYAFVGITMMIGQNMGL